MWGINESFFFFTKLYFWETYRKRQCASVVNSENVKFRSLSVSKNPHLMAGTFNGQRRITDFPRHALDITVQDRRVVEIHHGTKPFRGGTSVFLRHIGAANRARVFHMTRAMAERTGRVGGQGGVPPFGQSDLWGFSIRSAMTMKQNKVKLWYLMLSLVALYVFFGCVAIHEEALFHGLHACTWDDFARLIMNYPRFLFNALITSLLNIFSGDMQFPVMVMSVSLLMFVYHLTFVRRR